MERLFQSDVHIIAKIRAALRPAATTAAASKWIAAKDLAENVLEDVVWVTAAKRIAATAAHAIFKRSMTKAIIGRFLLRIREHGICLANFLEHGFGFSIIRILIRMVFHRKFAISAFQRLFICISVNAEHVIVIAFAHLDGYLFFTHSPAKVGRSALKCKA